ncbi:hypothetical protein GOP47_0014879 [Adiantum capillus-veneris]|uniref:Derlin n=1 Tax=Adiantum capillus-veneris TaxID=13818 RepID=A0A9D4UMD9_ADICA|nr:hypothetical protein GOP47_0014879 [Adiantum capillus-veneris]
MSSPADYYKSLPPVSKAYGTTCFLTTLGYQLGLINVYLLLMDYEKVLYKFQVWRLLTNFLFLGPFSINFGIRLLMIARYGVQLEQGTFQGRTADFLWMMLFSMFTLLGIGLIIPPLRQPIMGPSLVFMLLYLWSREYASARINIMGLFTVQGFYLPWVMLLLNVIFGSPLVTDLMGIIVGHVYYFLTVLHPRNRGRNFLKTPLWVHKLTLRLLNVVPQVGVQAPPQPASRGTAFTGRSYRLQ